MLPSIAGLTGDSYLHPDIFASGFHEAVLIAAAACVIGALIAVVTIRNPVRAPTPPPECWQCPLDAPLLGGTGAGPAQGPGVIAASGAPVGS